MKLNSISDNSGARKLRNRVGRGIGSGNGKTSGRGQKGLGARSGGKVRLGFEGGQNPLYLRLPMRGFNNYNFQTVYATVNVGDLQRLVDEKRLDAKKTITVETLQAIGLFKKAKDGLKVLGNGEVSAKLTIDATAASKSAIEKIAKAGGELKTAPVKENASGTKLQAKSDEVKAAKLAARTAKKAAKSAAAKK